MEVLRHRRVGRRDGQVGELDRAIPQVLSVIHRKLTRRPLTQRLRNITAFSVGGMALIDCAVQNSRAENSIGSGNPAPPRWPAAAATVALRSGVAARCRSMTPAGTAGNAREKEKAPPGGGGASFAGTRLPGGTDRNAIVSMVG